MRLDFELASLADTDSLGAAVAPLLEAGDVLALEGELGSGKTALVRAIAVARGVDPALISSPTFVIVNEYPVAGGTPLAHVDAYRLSSRDDLDPLGWDRLGDGSCVLLVEWAGRIADALPPERTARLALRATGEASRHATLDVPESWARRPVLDALRVLAIPARAPTTCPVTGKPVPSDSLTWPFADERARMADLYRWFSGSYNLSRPIEGRDVDEG